MPVCPECGVEYRDGFTLCSDCGAALVESAPLPKRRREPPAEEHAEAPAYLMTAAGEEEAGVLEALLREADIPVRRVYREAGEYMKIYMGYSGFGIDLLVPAPALERAAELVKSARAAGASVESSPEDDAALERAGKKRRMRVWLLLLLLFGLPLLVGAIRFLIFYIRALWG